MPARRRTAGPRATRDTGDVPRPELGLLEASVGYRLRRAQLAVFARVSEGLRLLDLRPGQVGVLMMIDRNPGLTQAEVCAALGIQRANLAPLVKGLERRGIVERLPVRGDRRLNALHLTAVGRRLLGRALAVHRATEAWVTRRLGAEGRRRLLGLLELLGEDRTG